MELLKESGISLEGKFVSQLTTSKHFYDVTAHRYIQDNCQDLKMKYIRGLSADMDDLLSEKGRKEALQFFRYVCWCMKQDAYEPFPPAPSAPKHIAVSVPEETETEKHGDVVIVTDCEEHDEQLKNMISANVVDNTEIFRITVTHPDPNTAELIANMIMEVFPQKISEVVEGSSARIVDYAVTPNDKASPSITKYTAIGMILGALIGCVISTCIELSDTLIRDEEYIIENYDIPVFAIVPNFKSVKKSTYYKYKYEYSSNSKRRGK
jgi:preprotein translocase subunit Sss1